MPTGGVSAGAVTTQPMVMPRPASAPTRLSRTGATPSARSTQRIVLASANSGAKAGATRAIPAVTGLINLPMGMILRCLPPEVLGADIAEFEASGASATEIGLPMNTVLNQLPSGKVEMTVQELVPHIPAGFLRPAEQLAPHLATLVSLPLMDVVMRIPPDLLALRPDQKDVDSSVVNMADPFTEEILREQAETAKRQGQTPPSQPNIIDEHQVPATEEFVPRDQLRTKSFVPPPRPLSGSSIAKTSGLGMPPPPLQAGPPTSAFLPPSVAPPLPGLARNSSPVPPPAPNSSSRRISPSGRLPAPMRVGSPLPMRAQAAPTTPVALPPSPAGAEMRTAPLAPPFPGPASRPTAPMPRIGGAPAPSPQTPQPPLRPTVSIPMVTPAPVSVPAPVAVAAPTPFPAVVSPSSPTPEPAARPAAPSFPLPGQPDAAAAELQRLAALAMQAEEAPPADAPVSESEMVTVPIKPPSSEGSESATAAIAAEAPSIPPPLAPAPLENPAAILQSQPAAPASRSISAPPAPPAAPPAAAAEEKPKDQTPGVPASEPSLALNLNNCTTADLIKIPGCSQSLAESIMRHRAKIGSFKRIEDLLEVPGMNSSAYRNLTGEEPPSTGIPQSLTELLGFPDDQKVTLKDVTDRICCWPDVTGCILGQSTGLSLVGTVPKNFDKAAIVAFAPRMFESINKSFGEIAGKETNELIIPTAGTSFHILRNGDLYLIILSRLPQMPDRHVKIARLVLAGLNMLPA